MGLLLLPPMDERTVGFLEKQHIFFVASAPMSAENRVNVSPKSAKEFRVIDGNTVGYVDYYGSGNETSAHLMENGRLTVMFAAFEGPPNITRLYGKGKLNFIDQAARKNERLLKIFGATSEKEFYQLYNGARSIITLDIKAIGKSCGYSIPKFQFVKDRTTLQEAIAKYGDVSSRVYDSNSFSIDGLKGVGQILRKRTPDKMTLKENLYVPSYGASSIGMLWVLVKMKYAAGVHGRKRDLLHVLLGAVLCLAFAKLRRRLLEKI